MSTDFDAVCDVCRVRCHFGQLSVAGGSLAYGGEKWPTEAAPVLRFVMEHAYCDPTKGTRIVLLGEAGKSREWLWDEGEPYPEPNEG
jgi:hypothetical protein